MRAGVASTCGSDVAPWREVAEDQRLARPRTEHVRWHRCAQVEDAGPSLWIGCCPQSQRFQRKNAVSPIARPSMKPQIAQKAAAVSKPGKWTFIPKIPVIN